MNKHMISIAALPLLIFGLACQTGYGQNVTQTIPLVSGWNAIWVEVEPTNNLVNAVFTNLPVESVWPYIDKLTPAEFIRELSEPSWNEPGWRRWLPPDSPHAILTTLFAVNAGKSYLVKMTNAGTLRITGMPKLKPTEWVPDMFNLRGFQVASAGAPRFGDFFAASGAHTGQPVYRLDAAMGVWTNVNLAVEQVQPGKAYWVYCQGASTYPGPLKVKLDQGDSLDFGATAQRQDVFLQNLTSSGMNIGLNDLSGGPTPLSLISLTTTGYVIAPLPATYFTSVGPGLTERMQLAVSRKGIPGTNFTTILEITNNAGSRILLRVNADKLETGALGNPYAGLWVGSASVSNVCEVNSLVNFTNPTPTKSGFDLRLLIHVHTNGSVGLLKEVIQMWQNGTSHTNGNGIVEVDRPGRYVLLSYDGLVSQFEGAGMRDGVAVGRRVSSVGIDFDGGISNYLALAGSFGGTNKLSGTIVLEPDFPTNPFRHKYHPDHDNLDANFIPMQPNATGSKEAYRIQRLLQLEFSANDPAGTSSLQSLDYGYDVIGGTYRETVTGLHKNPIVAEGSFRLNRVSTTGILNQ